MASDSGMAGSDGGMAGPQTTANRASADSSSRSSARRISHKRTAEMSEAVAMSNVSEMVKDCGDVAHGTQRRLLRYRRLQGLTRLFGPGRPWPQRTRIHCWNCRLPFDTMPIPLVMSCDEKGYDVSGVTCNVGCGKRYLMQDKSNRGRMRLIMYRKMLIEYFNWPPDQEIPMSPPWQAIDVFGGHMTVEEYRRLIPGVTISLLAPPFIPFQLMLETEHRGEFVIDQTRPPVAPVDSEQELVRQAREHGSVFDLTGLKRPPEDRIIRTEEDLANAHPLHDVALDRVEPFFQQFLQSAAVPTPEMCSELREAFEARRKDARKIKGQPGNGKKLVPFQVPNFQDPNPLHPGPPHIDNYQPTGPFRNGAARVVRFSDDLDPRDGASRMPSVSGMPTSASAAWVDGTLQISEDDMDSGSTASERPAAFHHPTASQRSAASQRPAASNRPAAPHPSTLSPHSTSSLHSTPSHQSTVRAPTRPVAPTEPQYSQAALGTATTTSVSVVEADGGQSAYEVHPTEYLAPFGTRLAARLAKR